MSAMRRPRHEGQKPRRLQLNATSRSKPQRAHPTRTQPCSRIPATQVLLDLAHHEARQPAGLLGSLAERRPVRVDRAVEHRFFAAVALVVRPVCRVVERCALSHGRTAQGRVVPARASPA